MADLRYGRPEPCNVVTFVFIEIVGTHETCELSICQFGEVSHKSDQKPFVLLYLL